MSEPSLSSAAYQLLLHGDDEKKLAYAPTRHRLDRQQEPLQLLNCYKFLVAITFLVALVVYWCISSPSCRHARIGTVSLEPSHEEGTSPTLLNILYVGAAATRVSGSASSASKQSPLYIHSHNNPLYDRLERAHWESEMVDEEALADDARAVQPRLSVDRTSIRFYEPLLLTWTPGARLAAHDEDESSSVVPVVPVVTNETLIILFCSENKYMDEDLRDLDFLEVDSRFPNPLAVKDAATVQQALETSNFHLQQQINNGMLAPQFNTSIRENAWFLPRFPAIRHKYCQFRMYQSVAAIRAPDMEQTFSEVLVPIAESPRITIQSLHTPQSIHLALTTDPSQMTVDFVTGIGSDCQVDGVPIVEYGMVLPLANSSSSSERRQGVTDTYTADDLCQAPANERKPGKFSDPGCLHSVVMDGLAPDSQYWYRVGVDNGQGVLEWSSYYEFTSTPPARLTNDPNTFVNNSDADEDFEPFAFLAYGDQGCPATGWTRGAEWVARMVQAELDGNDVESKPKVRMIHHIGDLSYAEGAAHVWDEWQHMIEPITARVPYMIGIGNHEYDHKDGGIKKDPSGVMTDGGFSPDWGNFGNDSKGECGVPTAKRFTMPKSSTSNGVFWYSFDFSNVHTIMISSEHDLQEGSPQHEWLENDLRTVDRGRTPWVIVETHRPLYHPDTPWKRDRVSIGMRCEFEDLLQEYNVDLVLAGHFHFYHRTCAGLYREKCNQGGSTHVTIGSAGARLDIAPRHRRDAWTAKTVKHQFGYGRITVMNDKALHFEFVKVGDADDRTSGEVGDEFWIYRE